MPTETQNLNNKLWDEITIAICFNMTHRLLPVIEEVYGKQYPEGTSIQLLGTEHSTYLNNPSDLPSSKLMDIAILVAGTDYYHIECQMENDSQMTIHMIAYDFHFGLLHSTTLDEPSGEIVIHFPKSVVIYPEINKSIPNKLRCRLIFADESEHIYQIPTIKIQTYSLHEILDKKLDFFLPFSLLRFRPRLNKLSEKELTDFVDEIIVILNSEVNAGILTELEAIDYINLLNMASERIFYNNPTYHEEVLKVTEPLIKLPSTEILELKEAVAERDNALAEKDNALAEKEAYIIELERKLAEVQKMNS